MYVTYDRFLFFKWKAAPDDILGKLKDDKNDNSSPIEMVDVSNLFLDSNESEYDY